MPLFGPIEDGLAKEIRNLEPEAMTPLEALNKIAELKKMVE